MQYYDFAQGARRLVRQPHQGGAGYNPAMEMGINILDTFMVENWSTASGGFTLVVLILTVWGPFQVEAEGPMRTFYDDHVVKHKYGVQAYCASTRYGTTLNLGANLTQHQSERSSACQSSILSVGIAAHPSL